MSKKITVNVEKTHIAKGKPRNCKKCPIALALLAKGFTNVHVGPHTIDFKKGKVLYEAHTPVNALRFMDRFDTAMTVRPIKVVLTAKPVV